MFKSSQLTERNTRLRKHLLVAFASVVIATLCCQAASAQWPSGLKLPKVSRPKPTPTPAESAQPASANETRPAATQPSAPAAQTGPDQPTLQKDTIQVNAWTKSGNSGVWSWTPRIQFRVNGPIPSGSQLYVEFQKPGGSAPWLSFDCETGAVPKDYNFKTECGGRAVEDKSLTAVGPVTFSIKLRNELAGTNMTLFTGKFKVARTLSNASGPNAANEFVYYVDHDWNLPIGYVYYTPDGVFGWDYPTLNVAFWVRGGNTRLDPHLFYQGKEIGREVLDGVEVTKAACRTEQENDSTHSVNDATGKKLKW